MRPAPRAALVTGASRRVGRALCLALAREGYALALHHRDDPGETLTLAGEIEAFGGRAAPVAAELSNEAETGRLIAAAQNAVGPLTLLVNNASRFQKDEIFSLGEAELLDHFRPNLFAPLRLARDFAEAARSLPEGSDPSIINILDQRVLRPNPQFFSYTLSKAALHTATLTLAQALAPGVRVNAIAPGPTLPSIHQEPGAFDAESRGVPLGRSAAIADIAAAALYLAGARSVTGAVIAVDAGQHLGWRTPDIVGP